MTKSLLELRKMRNSKAEGIIKLKEKNFVNTGLVDENGNKFVYNKTEYMSKALSWIDYALSRTKSSQVKPVSDEIISSLMTDGITITQPLANRLIPVFQYVRTTKITQTNVRTIWENLVKSDFEYNEKDAGVLYRTTERHVNGFRCVSPENITSLMDSMFKKYAVKSLIDVFVRHFYFEYVHPFSVANGVFGRLLLVSDLNAYSKKFYYTTPSCVIQRYFGQYCNTLALGTPAIDGFHDMTPFIEFMLYVIATTLSNERMSFKETSDDYILRKLNNSSVVSKKELIEDSPFARQTINNMLKKLEDKGEICKVKSEGEIFYSLSGCPVV